MDIKLIISDIDGTLIDSTEEIPVELIELINRCRKKGIKFAIATGRTKELADTIIQKLDVTEPCVIANGACVVKEGHCLVSHGFSAYPIKDIIERADRSGLTVTFSDETRERAIRETDYVANHQKIGKRFESYMDLLTLDWEQKQFIKIMFMDENRTGAIKKFREELMQYEDQYWVTTYSDRAVELGPKNCNKATGLHELTEILGIDMNQVMACGDFMNDMEMIREAGIGVAVGNANGKLKEIVDYTAKAVYCLGVIEAVEKYCF